MKESVDRNQWELRTTAIGYFRDFPIRRRHKTHVLDDREKKKWTCMSKSKICFRYSSIEMEEGSDIDGSSSESSGEVNRLHISVGHFYLMARPVNDRLHVNNGRYRS
jgi:hypothetical protein